MTAGLLVLTAVVVGSAVMGAIQGFPGPGATSVAVHLGGSAVALLAQRRADRRAADRRAADRRGALAALAASMVVLIVAAAVLYTQWWT